jgi:hypothetical protein
MSLMTDYEKDEYFLTPEQEREVKRKKIYNTRKAIRDACNWGPGQLPSTIDINGTNNTSRNFLRMKSVGCSNKSNVFIKYRT